MADTLDFENIVTPERLAEEISSKYVEWKSLRRDWDKLRRETRNFVFATDTRNTTVGALPHRNSTTRPHITKIYDILKASYTAALFPNSKWVVWKPLDNEQASKKKALAVEAYMRTKISASKFEMEMDKCIDDFILTGNCFATVIYDSDVQKGDDGVVLGGYTGPRLVRISPNDIVFNPVASSFEKTPKIIRNIYTLGDLYKMAEEDSGIADILPKMLEARQTVAAAREVEKSEAFVADGFSTLQQYYGSGSVEVLSFYGDMFDTETGELLLNHRIDVIDRMYVIKKEPVANWLGHTAIFHAGWRKRPDNLYAMGPLDNLVGMQYRLDHLENLKADVFDMIAAPVFKEFGEVQDWDWIPGEKIQMGEDSDVVPMSVDGTALNADLQISILISEMEEIAGAPKLAMGIRTPGEKTAYEYASLESAASRIFQHKAAQFERDFSERALNAMLESGRRNLVGTDNVETLDTKDGTTFFTEITKDDITGNGVVTAIGARHFAERNLRIQNLNNLLMAKQDDTIKPHLSGKKAAELMAEELGERELYGPNIAIQEQMETQRAMDKAEVDYNEEQQVNADLGL